MTEDDLLRALFATPDDAATVAGYIDWLVDQDREKDATLLRAGKMPLTGQEILAAAALTACDYAPATFEKRFARETLTRVAHSERCLSPRGWALMWKMVGRYRRQIISQGYRKAGAALVARAKALAAPGPAFPQLIQKGLFDADSGSADLLQLRPRHSR